MTNAFAARSRAALLSTMNSRRLIPDMGFLFPHAKRNEHCYGSHTFPPYIGCR
jgi:hypothetical protein